MTDADTITDAFKDLIQRQQNELRRRKARSPRSATQVIAQVMTRRGYGQTQAAESLAAAWQEAAGPRFAPHSRVVRIRRGVLEVVVANSTLLQEITFSKSDIVAHLAEKRPELKIQKLRCRCGSL